MAETKSKSRRLSRIWELLEDRVFSVPSRDDAFNFYRDVDSSVDRSDGDEIRRKNLRRYLEDVVDSAEVLVVGQSPGWRDCRFSGVPFTSQAQLLRPDFPVNGDRSSRGPNPLSERTATQLWENLLPYYPTLLFWYSYPIHGHRPGATQTDRTPTRRELDEFGPVVEGIYEILDPEQVVAVGRSAQTALENLEIEHSYVRHPAYGGVRAFRRGVSDVLEDDEEEED